MIGTNVQTLPLSHITTAYEPSDPSAFVRET
ncbi:hypothetical protein M2105_006346 [Paenibacillus sp. PastF-1]|nr:hypothetical protein [Paenibacillus sp. PastF-2]MDF9851857.1 hypothetical protein [Paenibacillus sp. PastM-2]MDF9858428.1 hypothetical protein [Paenibacillus sp. PastF-1]MDH6483708.1 hypothetical protein [Paenibacillus sp. PastH-2]MDH6511077.1 hypothetical protein [Paenibacillus sp. PastM-3]